ncbi:MAG: DNA primase DnaG [Candidatus Heimdallarchaeaceae archaeon]
MGAKTDTSTTKYEIIATFEIDGVVEKPDIIGGIYGQTDGLLSENLDIRELQKTGKIGRINVELKSRRGKTTGKITVPSSLPRMETAILAATLETVDRVGPCSCKIQLEEIVDLRINKRQSIVDRASEIIRQWDQNVSPFSSSITSEVEKSAKKASKPPSILSLSDEGFSAGPSFERQKKIILVEGRADVVNLLKYGIDNTIAVNGTSVSPKLIELIKKKNVTAFLDGDKGGDLILKELLQVSHVEFVARAPEGKEVEDLNEEEVKKALNNAVPLEEAVFLKGVDKGLTVKEFQEKSSETETKKKRLITIPRSKKEAKREVKKRGINQEEIAKARAVVEKITKPKVREKATERPTSRASSTASSRVQKDKTRSPTRRTSSEQGRQRSRTTPSSRSGSTAATRKPSSTRQRQVERPPRKVIRKIQLPAELAKAVTAVKAKLNAIVLDEENKELLQCPVAEIFDKLADTKGGVTLVVDGVITQRLLERAYSQGIKTIIGARKGEITKKPTTVKIIEYSQL